MRTYSRLSILSVVLTAIAITVNHVFVLGPAAFALGAVLLVLPPLLMWWFTATNSRVALVGYLLMNLWIIVGFGLIKGLWEGGLRLFLGTFLASVSTAFPQPVIGTAGFELSGLLTFIGSVFVLYYGYKFLQTTHASNAPVGAVPKSAWVIATSAFVVVTGLATAWAAT